MSDKEERTLENNNHEGFGLGLALVDFIPCLAFAAGAFALNTKLHSVIFIIGTCICLLAGLGKVSWKLVLAFTKKDIRILFLQMRALMPAGFLMMMIGIILKHRKIVWSAVGEAIISMPSLLFFVLWIAGIALMSIFAKKLDPDDAKSNWIEQCTNALAQGCFAIGVILAVI